MEGPDVACFVVKHVPEFSKLTVKENRKKSTDSNPNRIYMSNGLNYLLEEMDTGHLGRPLSVLHKAFQT